MKAVLTIGGSDCSTGSGIQRDLKVFYEKQIYAASVITAVTAQNSQSFFCFKSVSKKLLLQQLQAVFDEFDIHFVKIGMLGTSSIVKAVSHFLVKKKVYIVYDPVMKTSSGGNLTDPLFIATIKNELLPLVELLTPNIMECEQLSNRKIRNLGNEELESIYYHIGVNNLLIKGGHWFGAESIDYLIQKGRIIPFAGKRIDKEVRGTGCSLSSAIVSELFWGRDLACAIESSKIWLWEKMSHTLGNKFL